MCVLACEIGYYKDTPGIAGCIACPAKSTSKTPGATYCECENGFYRSSTDPKSAPCNGVPSPPRDLRLTKIDHSQATISWMHPKDPGSRSNVWYRIDCPTCPADTSYIPRKNRLNSTSVTLTNLEASSSYTINVFAENDFLAQMDGKLTPQFSTINITTLSTSKTSKFGSVRIESVSPTEVTINWDTAAQKLAPTDYTLIPPPLSQSRNGAAAEDITSILIPDSTAKPGSRKNQVRYYILRVLSRAKGLEKPFIIPPAMYNSDGEGVIEKSNETIVTNSVPFTFRGLQPVSNV